EITTDSVLIVDPEWRVAFINGRAEASIADGRELLGEDLWDAFPDAIGTVFDERFHAAMHGRTSLEFEAFYAPLDAWFHVRLYPVREGLMVLFRNTTEQQRAQQALRESELRFRTLADTVPEIL